MSQIQNTVSQNTATISDTLDRFIDTVCAVAQTNIETRADMLNKLSVPVTTNIATGKYTSPNGIVSYRLNNNSLINCISKTNSLNMSKFNRIYLNTFMADTEVQQKNTFDGMLGLNYTNKFNSEGLDSGSFLSYSTSNTGQFVDLDSTNQEISLYLIRPSASTPAFLFKAYTKDDNFNTINLQYDTPSNKYILTDTNYYKINPNRNTEYTALKTAMDSISATTLSQSNLQTAFDAIEIFGNNDLLKCSYTDFTTQLAPTTKYLKFQPDLNNSTIIITESQNPDFSSPTTPQFSSLLTEPTTGTPEKNTNTINSKKLAIYTMLKNYYDGINPNIKINSSSTNLSEMLFRDSNNTFTLDIADNSDTSKPVKILSIPNLKFESVDQLISNQNAGDFNAYSPLNNTLYVIPSTDITNIASTSSNDKPFFTNSNTKQILAYSGGNISNIIYPSIISNTNYCFYTDGDYLFYRIGTMGENSSEGYMPSNVKYDLSKRQYVGSVTIDVKNASGVTTQQMKTKTYVPAKIVYTNYTRIQTPALSYVAAASHNIVSKKIYFKANTTISGESKTNVTNTTDATNITNLTSTNTVGGGLWGQKASATIDGSINKKYILKSTDNKTSDNSETGILKVEVTYSTIEEKAPAVELIQNLCLQNANKT